LLGKPYGIIASRAASIRLSPFCEMRNEENKNGGMKYEDECENERTFGRPLGAIVGREVRTETEN